MSFEDLNLDVQGEGGNQLPYSAYIEGEIQVSFLPKCDIQVPVLVVPVTNYGLHVPVVIGTNVIRLCRNSCDSEATIPDTWKNAFVSFQQSSETSTRWHNERRNSTKLSAESGRNLTRRSTVTRRCRFDRLCFNQGTASSDEKLSFKIERHIFQDNYRLRQLKYGKTQDQTSRQRAIQRTSPPHSASIILRSTGTSSRNA